MFNKFLSDESGAVTVDWVVLTGAIVGLGIATYGVVSGGISNLSGDVDTHMRQDWVDTAWWTGPSIIESTASRASALAGACYADRGTGETICGPSTMHSTTQYTMSDGSSWTHMKTQVGTEVTLDQWQDGDGEIVKGTPPEASAAQIAEYEAQNQPFNIVQPPILVVN